MNEEYNITTSKTYFSLIYAKDYTGCWYFNWCSKDNNAVWIK